MGQEIDAMDCFFRQKSEAARVLGQISTPKKAASSRENGKKGGRPKGFSPTPESRQKMSETISRLAEEKRKTRETMD